MNCKEPVQTSGGLRIQGFKDSRIQGIGAAHLHIIDSPIDMAALYFLRVMEGPLLKMIG